MNRKENWSILLIIAIFLIGNNIYYFSTNLGILCKGELPVYLYRFDATCYITQLQNMINFGVNQVSQYSNFSSCIPESLLPVTLLSPIYKFIGLKWFTFLFQLIFPSILLYLTFLIYRTYDFTVFQSLISSFFTFAINPILIHILGNSSERTIKDSLWLIKDKVLHLLKGDMLLINNWFFRFPAPGITIVLVVWGLLCILKMESERKPYQDYILAVINISIFYTAFFGWQAFIVLYAISLFLRFVNKELDLRAIVLFLGSNFLAGIGLYKSYKKFDEDTLIRAGALFSRQPSFEYSLPLLLILLIFIAIFVVKRSKYIKTNYPYFIFISLGLLLLTNQNIVTKQEIQLRHVTHYSFYLISILAIITLFKEFNIRFKKILINGITIITVVILSKSIYDGILSKPPSDYLKSYNDTKLIAQYLDKTQYQNNYYPMESYAVLKDHNTQLVDWALEPICHLFAYMPYLPGSDNSMRQETDILLSILLISEELQLNAKTVINTYNEYAHKAYSMYFSGPRKRKDIKPKPIDWQKTQLDFVAQRLQELEADDLNYIISRGKLNYLIIQKGLKFNNSLNLQFIKDFNYHRLYKLDNCFIGDTIIKNKTTLLAELYKIYN